MQYQKKVALSLSILHFGWQLTVYWCNACFLAYHFVKSEFSEVIKMCDF